MSIPVSPAASSSIVDRMRGAAMLDSATYEAVEHDTRATGQAAVVVALAAIAAAIGHTWRGGPGLISGLLGYLIGWAMWSGIAYLIGTRLFGGTATWGELLRTLGFAQAPGVLLVIGFIPIVGGIGIAIINLWVLIAGVVAIRQALDVSTGRAVAVALVGGVAWILVRGIVGWMMGVPIL